MFMDDSSKEIISPVHKDKFSLSEVLRQQGLPAKLAGGRGYKP